MLYASPPGQARISRTRTNASEFCPPIRGYNVTSQRPRSISLLNLPKKKATILRAQDACIYASVPVGQTMGKEYVNYLPESDRVRRAGVLLHPTSLPGPYGIGELNDEAYKFIDWLGSAGFRCWQILPLVPPDPMYFSPYSGTDANGGNPLVISLQHLVRDGLLESFELPAEIPVGDCDFEKVASTKQPLLKKAASRLLNEYRFRYFYDEYQKFRAEHPWVEDSALFDVARNLEEYKELAWWDWPEPMRLRDPVALRKFKEENRSAVDEYIVIQYIFNKQWLHIRNYANSKGIQLVGDMPIYVGGHSADVWANQRLFELKPDGLPEQVSGVPPDAFSATGQRWGSPLYRWPEHEAEGFEWWAGRLVRAAELYDLTRIDHFRGFAGYWSVAAQEETAMYGSWRRGPGAALFAAVKARLGAVPILAEDLGVITRDVVALREAIAAPGMVVLQFAWGSDPSNVHLPHNHRPDCFVYTGTHDNETARGWFRGLPPTAADRTYLREYLGVEHENQVAPALVRASYMSVAETAVVPMQDLLDLDNSARMNTPGRAAGNWRWRIGDSAFVWPLLASLAPEFRRLALTSNRLPTSLSGNGNGNGNGNSNGNGGN